MPSFFTRKRGDREGIQKVLRDTGSGFREDGDVCI